MEDILEVEYLLLFTLHKFCNGYACPAADDLCNLLLCYLVAEETVVADVLFSLVLKLLELLLQSGQSAVFELCRLVEVVLTLSLVYLAAEMLDLLTELLNGSDVGLFVLPLCLHRIELVTQLRELLLNLGEVLLRDVVAFLFEGGFFDLELDYLS